MVAIFFFYTFCGKIKNMRDKETEKNSIWTEFIEFIRDIVISFVVIFVVFHFLVRPVQVKGSSMFPTLKDGDFAFSNVLGKSIGNIKRFDIVIIHIPEKNEYIVKRVIGLPGETVEYRQDQLYIDGEAVQEPFFDEEYRQDYIQEYGNSFTSDIASITLGEDEYYCLGDNRPNSSDSRVYGPFHKDKISSKGLFVLFPFSEAGSKTW